MITPKVARLKADAAAMAARGLTRPQIATLLKISRDRVDELLDEIHEPDPAGIAPEPRSALRMHYEFWRDLCHQKATWLADHGLRAESWAASAEARRFEQRARRA